jgi:hypothetical protein
LGIIRREESRFKSGAATMVFRQWIHAAFAATADAVEFEA